MQYRHGLTVGKFSPLHLGHEWLIETALHACADVTILSYSKPEFPGCERPRREAWLRKRFPTAAVVVLDDTRLAELCAQRGIVGPPIPHNDAADDEQRLFVAWVCERILGRAVDAVFTSESYGDGFAAVLDAHFLRTGGSIGRVRHVAVDLPRERVAVSGTMVRSDPHAYREFLSGDVYAGFVKRVCVLGGESSGKTTLASTLAERLHTEWAPEYGRELWERQSGALSYEGLVDIAQVQVEREQHLCETADRWLVCDTSPLTTLFYSLDLFGAADPRLVVLANRRYDCTLLCAPDFEFVQDGTRRDSGFRDHAHRWYLDELALRGTPWVLVGGHVVARVQTALSALHECDARDKLEAS